MLIADPRGPTTLVELDIETYDFAEGVDLEWSPDGSQLAILVSSSDSEQELWLVEEGVARRLWKFSSAAHGGGMAWTDDGRSLLVAGECCANRPPSVQLVDVDTGNGRAAGHQPLKGNQ